MSVGAQPVKWRGWRQTFEPGDSPCRGGHGPRLVYPALGLLRFPAADD